VLFFSFCRQLCSKLDRLLFKLRKELAAQKEADPGHALGVVNALQGQLAYIWDGSERHRLAAMLFDDNEVHVAYQVRASEVGAVTHSLFPVSSIRWHRCRGSLSAGTVSPAIRRCHL
jgi:hypothetical protein